VTSDKEHTLPPASILGIGAMTPLGRDLDGIARKLREPCEAMPQVLRVDDALLADPALSRHMRRADRFARMAAMAALDAWNSSQAGCTGVPLERIGMIVSSGFGPQARGFRFLDGILDCGDDAASPTDFSHSVHGAAAAYISGLLGLRGPSLNATDFEIGFEEVVRLAQCWLAEGACDRVLIGAVDELGEVMLHCASVMVKDFASVSPGEGAVFLMLGPGGLPGIARVDAASEPTDVDVLIREQPTVTLAEGNAPRIAAKQTISFSRYFGHSASSTAFHLLGGILAMRGQLRLGYTVDNAATFRTSSDARAATLLLTKGEL
jgi:hypothetical protein